MLCTREIDKGEPSWMVCSQQRIFYFYFLEMQRSPMRFTYPLQRPLSSNVPIRIFRIQGSFAFASAPSLVRESDETTTASLPFSFSFSLVRWASKRPLIDSTVVSNPRLPKKSVGAGGCFCAECIFCANLEWPDADTAGFTGRPSKLSPGGEGGGRACKGWRRRKS